MKWQEPGPAAFVGPPPELGAARKKSNSLGELVGKLKPESSAEVLARQGAKEGQSMPTRTWVLLAITLAAAVGLLFWEEETAPDATSAALASATATAQDAGASTRVSSHPDAGVRASSPPRAADASLLATSSAGDAGSLPGADAGPSEVAATADASTPETAGAAPAGPSEGPSLARQAADAYIAGRYAEALVAYRALGTQTQDPADMQQRAYATMVRVLERRLRCDAGGDECPRH
jgi:hypothetical protein